MLKLLYMVDDKMYVCFIGLYFFIMQQLLGGKVQFGGQCFGEMEVWVFEVFGVVNILQELFIIKLDDINGCVKVYEFIVKGDLLLDLSILELFNVLVYEFCGLVLDVKFDQVMLLLQFNK